jgi:hypothetical protein
MRPIARTIGGLSIAVAIAGVALSTHVGAQPTQPIYLQYDGFVRNKDGTFTVSFGYYNLNNTDVTIQPGDANTFTPAPVDRSQTVVFLKGRHRFACSMVVEKTFDDLQWTVKFAGKTSTTTSKTTDPLYELELNSEKRAIRGVDSATAPRNVCINRAPNLQIVTSPFEAPSTSDAELTAKLGQELAINAQVEDDGLPRGSHTQSTWKTLSGPGTATFSDASAGATRVTFTAAGTYELELSATDGEKNSSLKVTVHVAEK